MLHRSTLVAVPIIGLAVIGAATGWWNYFDERGQKQALAYQAEMQYNSSFHGLATDMRNLQEELGKSLISTDATSFQKRLRDIWRITFAAQANVARLPFALMPMHHTQQFLSRLADDVDSWTTSNADPKNATIHQKLKNYFTESNRLYNQLNVLQGKVMKHQMNWSIVDKALASGKQDNQIIDGFRKLDTQAAIYGETNDGPTTLNRGRTNAFKDEPEYSARHAESRLAEFIGVSRKTPWNVSSSQKGAYDEEYNISGATPLGQMFGVVSKRGGHVLSFRIHHSSTSKSEIDFSDAETRAEKFLAARHFGPVQLLTANQYGGTGYFVFAPLHQGIPVTSQSLVVKIALSDGVVMGYDGTNYYYHPLKSLPSRIYSTEQLRKKLNPAFLVRMQNPVIVLDEQNHYQPAVAFYGTNNKETYCVYMNAHTGKEITIEQLTSH
jgi:spore germination protein